MEGVPFDNRLEKKISDDKNQQKAMDYELDVNRKTFECSLCGENGKKTAASCFCTSCKVPEPFCDSCGQHHIQQKNTCGHSLSSDMKMYPSVADKNSIDCEQCILDGENRYACSFCLTCEEPEALCEDCAAKHIRQKAFRDHKFCNDLSQLSKRKRVFCEPCSIEGNEIQAISFCNDCNDPEPMCTDCAKQHLKQRQFRNHSICDDITKLSLESEKNSSVVFCGVCKEDSIDSKATCFCQDCDDQEPLCSECARQHTRQKSFRGHKLCDNLSLLSSVKTKAIFCDICKIDGQDVLADAYCRDCLDPEPMCKSCAGHHIKQKQFRSHYMCKDISFFRKLQNKDEVDCDICKIDGKHLKAAKFCEECDEYFCVECGEAHLKFSREHVLTDQMSNSIHCEPCKRGNKTSFANSFCENCEEPMCNVCSEQHKKQKPSRGHIFSKHFLKFSKSTSEKDNNRENASERLDIGEKNEKEKVEIKRKTRGKPSVLNIKSDSVELCWERFEEDIEYYQIRYKSLKGKDKWKFCNTNDSTNKTIISGLMADTPYLFQVRSVANDVEGDYSEQSDPINTTKSLATKMLNFSIKMPDTYPVKYQLASEENREARNINAKTRQLTLGNPKVGSECERTMMLLGATGSGKSTLVDGIINYILGVSFEDPFRFTLVNLEQDEKKTDNQAESQTEWITVYKIAPQEGSRLDYTLNVIDTPGFGDTRGLQRDKAIVDQIRHLFSAEGKQGVSFIDAVCFIVKAPDARLTATQTYIFHSITSLFGKDIESNICTLVTFADGADPPVLSCLKAANLPFGSWFPFNNSALFANNKNLPSTTLSPMFWDMGCKSFQNFFEKLKTFTTKSLLQTKDVLKQREHLQSVLTNIQPQVNAGLMKLNELQNTLNMFKKHQTDIESNKDFTYETEVTKQVKLELPVGQHVTNCLNCNISCHDNCAFADDDQKSRCAAMDSTGNCQVCSSKCHWSQHKNAKYIFKYVTEKKTETYQEKKKLYEKAKGEKMTNEKYLEEIEADIDCLYDTICKMMEEMALCKNRLKEIALRPDPLSAVEHIDQMIQAEEINKQVGYEQRIKMLNEFKQLAQTDQRVESFGQTVLKAKDDLFKTTGRNQARKGILRSGFDRFKSVFNM